MTYNSEDLKQLETLWKEAVEAEATELQFPIPDEPQFPSNAVPIPISSTARHKAARMANLCRDARRRETMRRNLLATIAVHDYLRFQGYLPDLGASDCWNPILGRTGEVADLVVSQVGRFECCAIEPSQSSCSVPMEGQFGRTGYVTVEIDSQERWGWLLGFIPGGDETNPVETLNREELQSMDEFGGLLHRLWLLWNIVQEGSEPWDVEMRSEMVALLERIYRTRSAAQRPMRAAAEIIQLWEEKLAGVGQTRLWSSVEFSIPSDQPPYSDPDYGDLDLPSSHGSYGVPPESRELAGAGSREGNEPNNRELRQFLRGVFDRLEDSLAIEEEADNG
jgi:Protein of unknown function (DUF1822)